MSGETGPPRDPLELMRAARAETVERWSEALEQIVGSEGFAAASGQLLALYAQQQQALRAASRVFAESIQMPTTEDLAEVAQLVINVERKVEEVTDQSADVATRLTAIEARLDSATAAAQAIPGRLAAIEEQLARAATAAQALSERLTPIEVAIRVLAQEPADRPGREAGPPAGAQKPVAKPRAAKRPAADKSTAAGRRTPPAHG